MKMAEIKIEINGNWEESKLEKFDIMKNDICRKGKLEKI